ncbi:MAG: hypothetical protein LPK80_05240 [Bacteroidota bacterium]|nr:hypothetical protein [Bacteroidota bacterium]MDX5404014.1 hypothetical protein [Bacteroidota bacterium]MDX5428346.1 hypothetical protein [Bacteroidota bacterium]MDX5448290.1 hypothetical protein [Bacteroidota bacterium]MDX5506119.1 hypothetical protein [Bacteroidota bacterium]
MKKLYPILFLFFGLAAGFSSVAQSQDKVWAIDGKVYIQPQSLENLQQFDLVLLNITGQTVFRSHLEFPKGESIVSMDLPTNLPRGLYLVQIHDRSGPVRTYRLKL